jgi:hypothetical protein
MEIKVQKLGREQPKKMGVLYPGRRGQRIDQRRQGR